MLFNSLGFALFLPIAFAGYWLLPRLRLGVRAQNVYLIAAGCLFYAAWDRRFLALLLFVALVAFISGLLLRRGGSQGSRRAVLATTLVVLIGVLAYFKYADFFVGSFTRLLGSIGLPVDAVTLHILLPVGVSFFVFQNLTYVFDVYRRQMEPTTDVISYLAFATFFPQLFAGPITRARFLLPQFAAPRSFDSTASRAALRQILNGLVKKVLIADVVAVFVDEAFAGYHVLDGVTLVIAVFFFAVQIYCDFSGYSDIAIGSGRLFGLTLSPNFAYPYFSRNISEFWRRWHMTLSSWFRDYVYIPLGGSRVSRGRHLFNVLFTFALTGLWHGADWTFVFWGFLNGLYYVPLVLLGRGRVPRQIAGHGRRLPRGREALAMLATFAAVCFAWVFFRADSMSQAIGYLTRIVTHPYMGLSYGRYVPWLIVCGVLFVVEWLQRERPYALDIPFVPVWGRWLTYDTLLLCLLLFGAVGARGFVYMQF